MWQMETRILVASKVASTLSSMSANCNAINATACRRGLKGQLALQSSGYILAGP